MGTNSFRIFVFSVTPRTLLLIKYYKICQIAFNIWQREHGFNGQLYTDNQQKCMHVSQHYYSVPSKI